MTIDMPIVIYNKLRIFLLASFPVIGCPKLLLSINPSEPTICSYIERAKAHMIIICFVHPLPPTHLHLTPLMPLILPHQTPPPGRYFRGLSPLSSVTDSVPVFLWASHTERGKRAGQ